MAWFHQKNVRNPNHHYFSKEYRNTPPDCIAIRLQFVLQYFWVPQRFEERDTVSTTPIGIAVHLPFVLQCASHLYRSTFGKILVVVVTGVFPILGGHFSSDARFSLGAHQGRHATARFLEGFLEGALQGFQWRQRLLEGLLEGGVS